MNKLLIIIIAAVIAGGGYLILRPDKSTTPTANTTTSQATTEQNTESKTTEPMSSTAVGAYVNYTSTVIASTKGTKILFFHAPWCPQCRALETSIKSGRIPEDVTIIKVDYDTNQSLRQKYGVTIQTTLVRINDDGQLVEKYVAYDSPTLAAVKENLL